MKLKPMLKFELHDSLRLLTGFYLIIITFHTLFWPFLSLFGGQLSLDSLLSWVINLIPGVFRSFISPDVRTIEINLTIFLFILGLISFSPAFRMSQSLHVSRRAMFLSQIIHVGIISTVTALLNGILTFVTSFGIVIVPIYYRMFSGRYYRIGVIKDTLRSPQFIADYFLYTFCISAVALMLGYFIGLCFYRLTRGFRRKFTIVAPVFVLPVLSFALPIIDSYLFGDIFTINIAFNFSPTYLLYNIGLSSPYFSMLFYLILFAVFAALSYLLIRRVTFDAPDPAKKNGAVNPLETSKGMSL